MVKLNYWEIDQNRRSEGFDIDRVNKTLIVINLKTYCRMKILFSYWATISLTAVKWAKMKSKPTYYKGKRKLNTNTTTCLDFNQNILVVNHCMSVGRGGGTGGRGPTMGQHMT